MQKAGVVYIVTNAHHTTLYIGVTSTFEKRIYQHKTHFYKKSFSDRYNLEKLVYYEFIDDIEVAIAREKELKKWSRSKKEALINSLNPGWEDLYDKVFC